MTRPPLVSVCFAAAVLAGGVLVAAESTSVLKPPSRAPQPRVAPSPAPPARAISPALAANLAAAAPKFEPIVAKPEGVAPERREADKPRNTIIRLPSYVVEARAPRVLDEKQLPTPQGRLDLALKRYPGLRLGSFWILRNDGIALMMLAEQERLEEIRDMQEMLTLMPAAERERLQPIVNQTFGYRMPPPR